MEVVDRYTFTVTEDSLVERTIQNHMNIIIRRILESVQCDSIILSGSFGRGEGTVVNNRGNLVFLSDYEIGIVTPFFWRHRKFKSLSKKLSEDLNVDISVFPLRRARLKRNMTRNLSFGTTITSSIFAYELLHGSRVIYSKDRIRSTPSVDPKSIPAMEGIKLIFNRMGEILGSMDSLSQASIVSRYWISKLRLACMDALLILINEYHYSYAERLKRFMTAVECGHFQDIFAVSPSFLSTVKEGADFKLKPSIDTYFSNFRKAWNDTGVLCDAVIRFIFNEQFRFKFDDYKEFQAWFRSSSEVANGLSQYNIRNFAGNVLSNLIYLSKLSMSGELRIILFGRLASRPWTQIVYSIIPLVFFSSPLISVSTFEPSEMSEVAHILSRFLRSKIGAEYTRNFGALATNTNQLWRIICY